MPKTLLLADDSVTIQKVVGISFANEDFVLQTVDNGDDAIARAREVRPDIVLADVVMPGKNGYEVCEAIKSDPQLAHVPVLLLTGTFEAFDDERARRVGADGHITKPFEAQALVDAVKQRLASAIPGPAAASAAAPPAPASPNEATIQSGSSGFDFLEDEHTEPSGLSSGDGDARTTVLIEEPAGGVEEAFAFEASDDVDGIEIGDSELDLEADLGDTPDLHLEDANDARTQLVMDDHRADSFESADTLPPKMVPAEPEEETRVGRLETEFDASLGDSDDALQLARPEAEESPFGPLDEAFGDPLADDAGDAVLDPTGARDYDVSSSDLGDPFEAPAPAEAARPAEPRPAPEAPRATPPPLPAPSPQADDDLLSRATDPELDADAFLMDAEGDLAAPEEPPAPAEQEQATPPPLAAPEPQPVVPPSLPASPAPTTSAAPAPAAGLAARPDLEPLLRDQLHGTLEKIAWEAFGDVAERLVKDALERIEKVAWEVIPQMAEALIQEEIRKLKGGE